MNPIKPKILPAFTIASILAPMLIGLLSYPIWISYLRNSDPTGKAGIFVVFALIILMTLSLAAGSAFGFILAVVGHVKKENWRYARISFMAINASIVGFGVYIFCSLPREASEAKRDIGSDSAELRDPP